MNSVSGCRLESTDDVICTIENLAISLATWDDMELESGEFRFGQLCGYCKNLLVGESIQCEPLASVVTKNKQESDIEQWRG